MKAIVLYEPGPAENLILRDIPDPELRDGNVLIRVTHAGINHGDIIRRQRGLPPHEDGRPRVLGFDGCGRIVDSGSTALKPGDRVAFFVEEGAYAELVSVPPTQIFAFPDTVDDAIAAAIPCVATTAWHLLRLASLPAQGTALVHGGSGGVGAMLLQLARGKDHHIFATVSTAEKAHYASANGADAVFSSRSPFADQIVAETEGRGVDVIFDCVGHALVTQNIASLRKQGKWLYYGSTSGHATFPGLHILSKGIQLTGFVIFDHLRDESWRSCVHDVVGAVAGGRLAPRVTTYPVQDVSRAHRDLEERKIFGKALLCF